MEFERVRVCSSIAAGRHQAQTLNISLGGTFVVSELQPEVDTDLHLWLRPPRTAPGSPRVLRFLARVRWCSAGDADRPAGFGVAFRALTAADEIALYGCFSRSVKVV